MAAEDYQLNPKTMYLYKKHSAKIKLNALKDGKYLNRKIMGYQFYLKKNLN
ncbi:MAG: hypothetical protein ACOX43_05770 [Bacilli bacterium]